jgi:hypothetical protein
MKIYTFDPKKGKNVLAGETVIFNSTVQFVKHVNKNHFMVLEHSYGIQEEVLQQLAHLGVTNIRIKTKTGIILSHLEDWLKQPIKNYGHGNQRFLKPKER